MAKHRLSPNTAKGWLADHPVFIWIIAAIVGAIGVYVLLFFVPRPIELTYASQKTCVSWPTLLPGIHQTIDDSQFTVQFDKEVKLFDVALLSTKTCVQPADTLQTGNYTVVTAPLAGLLYRQQLAITVPASPSVSAKGFDKPISTTKPLEITLASPDVLSAYSLKVGDKTAVCKPLESAAVQCDVAALAMNQGAEYDLQVLRGYEEQKPTVALTKRITTLTATTITEGSVKAGDVVYAKPTEFTFTTDKELVRARATLIEEGSSEKLQVIATVEGMGVKVALASELPRGKSYILTVDGVEAADGSSLAEPYVVPFKVSGGPKVVNVSVGKAGVSTTARITVTFDQPLSDKQDIAKFTSITGGVANVARSGAQITFTLQGLPLCTAFTLNVLKGLESNYDIASTAGWSYASRTICYTTSVYGYSAKGRALVAYHFGGAGPVTMYVGAIHGNEPSSSGLMKAWIDDLEANPSLYEGKRVVVVPTINPDGVAAGTRTNSRGVDLNRNFPTANWTSDSQNSSGTGSGGSEPLSEPEAKALAGFTSSMRPRLLLSFHAVGSLVVGDPGGYSAGYAAKYASMVGYRDTTYSTGGGFEYDITGAYEDWTYSKQGIPSMVIELGSYGYFNFPHHRTALRAMLN